MNGTPRMRSSYPSTPGTAQQSAAARDPAKDGHKAKPSLPNLPNSATTASLSNTPVIPVNLIDAPSQRMYTLALYGVLLVWRFYDWWRLVEEDAHSITLFLKWCFIDLAFLFGVPLLRIPWLEWSDTTSFSACFIHTVLNGMLMFRIPVCSRQNDILILLTFIQLPIEGWLLLLAKTVFDREMSISENSVRPASILHNSSLIMGKQIINILPEGLVIPGPCLCKHSLAKTEQVGHYESRPNTPLYQY